MIAVVEDGLTVPPEFPGFPVLFQFLPEQHYSPYTADQTVQKENMNICMILLISAFLASVYAGPALAQNYDFKIIEECEGNAPLPSAINDSGVVVGQAHSLNSAYSLGFVYADGSCKTYSLKGIGTSFLGITNSDQIVGLAAPDQNYLEANGVFQGLPNYPNADETYYCCLSQSGVLAGNYYPTGAEYYPTGFTYFRGNWFSLPLAYSISGLDAIGTVIGTYLGDYYSGFALREGKITYLQYPGAKETTFNGINGKDVIVGTYVLEGTQAFGIFLYNLQTETWTDLNFVYPYDAIMPVGINDSNVIAAQYTPSGGLLIATPSN